MVVSLISASPQAPDDNGYKSRLGPNIVDIKNQIDKLASLLGSSRNGRTGTDAFKRESASDGPAFDPFTIVHNRSDDQSLKDIVAENCAIYQYKAERDSMAGKIRLPKTVCRPDTRLRAAWDLFIIFLVVFYGESIGGDLSITLLPSSLKSHAEN